MPMLARRRSRAVWTFPETLDSAGSATAIVLIVTWLSETKEEKTKQSLNSFMAGAYSRSLCGMIAETMHPRLGG